MDREKYLGTYGYYLFRAAQCDPDFPRMAFAWRVGVVGGPQKKHERKIISDDLNFENASFSYYLT